MPNIELKNCKHHGLTEFVLEKRGFYRCKQCRKDHVSNFRRNLKKRLVEYFGGRCQICGYNNYAGALQFHHLDPQKKNFGISQQGMSRSYDNVLEEAKKCILLCGNCHSEVENGITNIPENFDNNGIVGYTSESIKPSRNLLNNKNCPHCGIEFKPKTSKQVFCKNECSKFHSRKVERPSMEDLKILIKENSFVCIAKMYNVSDKSVRKWAKKYGII